MHTDNKGEGLEGDAGFPCTDKDQISAAAVFYCQAVDANGASESQALEIRSCNGYRGDGICPD